MITNVRRFPFKSEWLNNQMYRAYGTASNKYDIKFSIAHFGPEH